MTKRRKLQLEGVATPVRNRKWGEIVVFTQIISMSLMLSSAVVPVEQKQRAVHASTPPRRAAVVKQLPFGKCINIVVVVTVEF